MTPYRPENAFLKQSKLRQIFERAPKTAINLGLGQPGEDTPPFIREAAARVVREQALGYTLNAGLLPLREKLAAEYASVGVTPDRICVTAGVQEALYALFYVLLDNSTEIVLPDPGFLTYPSLSGLAKCTPRYYTLRSEDNFQFRADRLIEAVTPRTSVVLLGHPSNPTGSVAPQEELRKLVEYAKNRKEGPLWIISDEVYFGMSYVDGDLSGTMGAYLDEYPYIILLRGASKSHHMTGWRLGWVVLPEELAKPYIAAHQYVTTCVSAVSQYTLLAVRDTQEEQDWLQYQNQLYRQKRDLVASYLSDVRPLFGGEGAFYWVMQMSEADRMWSRGLQIDGFDLAAAPDDEKWVLKAMNDHLVTTTPGSAFGKQTDGFIRISYGPRMEQLEEGLKRLKNLLT
jgi:aspartate aminotransferase